MSQKILVIDDESGIRQILKLRLERHGYTVRTAPGGQKGLRMARIEKPDLILLDVMMPSMDGASTAERLKADTITRRIPIVFITAMHVRPEEKEFGYRLGVDAILCKPFKDEDLINQVRRSLAKA